MYLPKDASKTRKKEAENARKNRAELKIAMNNGTVTRRDLIKMGIMTTTGLMVMKNGLNPYATSAYAQGTAIPTGTPRSVGPPAGKFKAWSKPIPRFSNLTTVPLMDNGVGLVPDRSRIDSDSKQAKVADDWVDHNGNVLPATKLSNHNAFPNTKGHIEHKINIEPGTDPGGKMTTGPAEGRPPGEFFAHQRWNDLIYKSPLGPVGFQMSLGQINNGISFFDLEGSSKKPNMDPDMRPQAPNAVWPFGEGRLVRGHLAPPILQCRYGEPVLFRNYTNLPYNIDNNGGFGRNQPSIHNHNAHNGSESDGATNAFMFPGQYYDTVFSTILARHDHTGNREGEKFMNRVGVPNPNAKGFRRWCSTPDDDGGIIQVPGDPREIQGTLWFHDHRFFFTAENVYKGFAALMEYFSGPDRGFERSLAGELGDTAARREADLVNLRLPSGHRNGKGWGNRDFDWYLVIQDVALAPDGNLFFDIMDTDGFLGDAMHVNWQVAGVMKVLPRKYRLRTISAGMSRWQQNCITDDEGNALPIQMIANDGNLLPHPVTRKYLDIQSTAERYDLIVDFSNLDGDGGSLQDQVGKEYFLVNRLEHKNGRGPNRALSDVEAFNKDSDDPGVGPCLKFLVVDGSTKETGIVGADGVPITNEIISTDDGTTRLTIANSCGRNDMSNVPRNLYPDDIGRNNLPQIPEVTPDRTRVIEFVRAETENGGLPFDHPLQDPWAVKIDGEFPHQLDLRRVSMLIPRPGEIEHWTIKSDMGWGHPVHLHFEEATTLTRGGEKPSNTEDRIRKDVWHIGQMSGDVKFQVSFGEFGGAYVNHCHNTIHEDNAMLLRYDTNNKTFRQKGMGDAVAHSGIVILPTPDPKPNGVTYVQPCALPEGKSGIENTGTVSDCTSGQAIGEPANKLGKAKQNIKEEASDHQLPEGFI